MKVFFQGEAFSRLEETTLANQECNRTEFMKRIENWLTRAQVRQISHNESAWENVVYLVEDKVKCHQTKGMRLFSAFYDTSKVSRFDLQLCGFDRTIYDITFDVCFKEIEHGIIYSVLLETDNRDHYTGRLILEH